MSPYERTYIDKNEDVSFRCTGGRIIFDDEPSPFRRFLARAGVVIVLTVTVASMVAGAAVVAGCLAGCADNEVVLYDPPAPNPIPTPLPEPDTDPNTDPVVPEPVDVPATEESIPYASIVAIVDGMTEEDLVSLLGRPDDKVATTWVYFKAQNADGQQRTLRVEVWSGKVAGYSLWRPR